MDVAVVAVSGQVTQALAQSPAVLDGGLGVVFDSQTGALLGSTNEVSPPFPPAQHHLCPLSMLVGLNADMVQASITARHCSHSTRASCCIRLDCQQR